MSLTLAEARTRADLLSEVSYAVHLDLTDRETFAVRTTVAFACSQPGASTFLELADALGVLVDGLPATTYDGRRIVLEHLAATQQVTVEARVPYVTDGDGMHTFTDPADGETYVSAYVGMDICQRVFPCFDQNDLKAPVALSVTAPEGWSVLANGRVTRQEGSAWEFAPTPPIPLPMFVVCAGPWHSRTWEHAGLPFGWHARASLADQLDRDFDEVRAITERCFDHYTSTFSEPYAFDSYDQAFVPGQNWGALETPGCVTYRDEILPVGTPTAGERRSRATVIAHEMAHMWFGDLATMTWWEDTWLQESFADYMGYRLAEEAVGFEGTWADFTITRKVGAYLADERRSTHPIAPLAEEVPDVDAALTNFDSISYAKGNSAVRQLVTWLGDDDFLAGVNGYFARHRFGNATLADFVDALDAATDRDVRGWVELWLRRSGFDTITATRDPADEGDGVTLTRVGSRPHRFTVTTYDETLAPLERGLVDLGDQPLRLPAAPVVVPNSGTETFARVRLDEQSWSLLAGDLASVPDDDTRALVWSTAFDMVRCGDLRAADFLGLVTRHLPRERRVGIVDGVLGWTLGSLVPRRLAPDEVADAVAQVAAACESGLASEPGEDVAVSLTLGLARTTPDPLLLQRWLLDRETHTGMPVEPDLRWRAVHRLAALGEIGVDEITDERLSDGTITGVLGAATALAAMPTPQAKAVTWGRLTAEPVLSNREFTATAAGFWDAEQTALVHPYVEPYLTGLLALARTRGQAFSHLVTRAFPSVPLLDEHVAALERVLTGDVPTVLRRGWEDALDDLRAAGSR